VVYVESALNDAGDSFEVHVLVVVVVVGKEGDDKANDVEQVKVCLV
jgi:hypothetical protein